MLVNDVEGTIAKMSQLKAAGVTKSSPDDSLTEADKERLLEFLRTSHGTSAAGERKKITLTRKSTSEIKQADASGKARTIQVEVRKKRVFVKRDDASPAVEEASGAAAEEADLQRREEEARAQAQAELARLDVILAQEQVQTERERAVADRSREIALKRLHNALDVGTGITPIDPLPVRGQFRGGWGPADRRRDRP